MLKLSRVAAAAAFLVGSAGAAANEIEGFRLGMSLDAARRLAAEKGYSFSNPVPSSPRWVSYMLMKEGPSISFCDGTLSAVTRQHSSNLHETAASLKEWQDRLGEPAQSTHQTYIQGTQYSNVSFRWSGQDNIRREVGISQFGQAGLQLSFSYSYIAHPCSSR